MRFSPSAWQLMMLDGLVGAVAFSLGLLLRFVDEPSVPPTYAQRALPWAIAAGIVQIGTGEVMNRLQRPGSPLARRPIAPFLAAAAIELLLVLLVNKLALPVTWTLPLSVAIFGPLLGSTGSAALRLAASRPLGADELLPRRVVQIDPEQCARLLFGKRVLITGAAGSIGSELARQVLAARPASLIAVDMNETGLFELQAELAPYLAPVRGETVEPRTGAPFQNGVALRTCIADVADARRMHELFDQQRPQIVFHAAAYKHVPLVEDNPDQAFSSNVLGTLVICEGAAEVHAERVVLISTDKAVNPTSFMGLTKRVAELIVAAMNQRPAGSSVFSVVRFGNVLGSRGSIVPTFLRQIEAGGPITITHPDVRRFFMTVTEAARLVLTAAASQRGGVFVLEMGDELRIQDLAEKLVRMKGLRPGRDVRFAYIGLRPGEKLREELHNADETLLPTEHPFVHRVQPSYAVYGDELLSAIRDLEDQRRQGLLSSAAYPAALRELISRSTQDQVNVAEFVPEVAGL
jgi:FlaA1/EpsC-like NDP-sugar epimerase